MLRFSYVQVYCFELDTAKVRLHKLRQYIAIYELFIFRFTLIIIDKYRLRTSIDQRGKQTMNRDAKTTGGIKAFTTKEDWILKWSLTRSDQASHTGKPKNLCGLSRDPGI